MKYGIVRSKTSSNFMVFPTMKEASDYVADEEKEIPNHQRCLYAEEANDPFMTFQKFCELPEFAGW